MHISTLTSSYMHNKIKHLGADVFNALDLMQNAQTFEELKFGSGDGFLQFYLYNWKCAAMPASQVGIVLL